MFSYEGKKAIVTGGGRGIGKAIAPAFARFPAPTEALYGAAKAAMVNFTQCLAYKLGRHRIRVNAIAPGVVETQLTAP